MSRLGSNCEGGNLPGRLREESRFIYRVVISSTFRFIALSIASLIRSHVASLSCAYLSKFDPSHGMTQSN
jgi:hypothetical protein